MRKYAKAVAGLLVSIAAVYAVARNVSLLEVAHASAGANKKLILAGIIAVGIGYGIRSFRWWLMLRLGNCSVSLGATARVLMAGFAANNLLPLRAGDALRVFGFRNVLNLSSSFLLATLALERLLDAVSLLILGLCFLRIGGVAAIPTHALRLITGLTLVGIIVLITSLIFTKPARQFSLRVLDKFVREPQRRNKITVAITNIFGLFESVKPSEAVHLLVLSLAAWAFETLLYLCTARALLLHVPLVWPCIALLTANFSSLVPSSPGYVGTFHASIVGTLLLAGVTRDSATAYAVIVHGVLWIVVTLAGTLGYLLLRRKPVANPTGVII